MDKVFNIVQERHSKRALESKKSFAFTLAEILITLTIIGVVSSLTIPTVINNTSKQQYVVGVKKAYSTFSQAVNMYIAENGEIESMFACSGTNAEKNECVLDNLAPFLNLSKKCGNNLGCFYDTQYYQNGELNRSDLDDYLIATGSSTAILTDGSMFHIENTTNDCSTISGDLENICGSVIIDINGAKPPNRRGFDFHYFWLTKKGVLPMGSLNDGKTCDMTSIIHIKGQGCTAKILQENAMNY